MKKHYEIARETLSFYGSEQTSLQNILAVLIGPEADPSITGQMASLGVNRLSDMTIEELKQFDGISDGAANRIFSAFGLADHIKRYKKQNTVVIQSPGDAAHYLSDLEGLHQEYVDVLYLNAKSHVISRKNIFKGSIDESLMHPREVFKEAIRLSAASIVVAHNHPSGDPSKY